LAFAGSDLIREVAFAGSDLIREVAFAGSDLIREVAPGIKYWTQELFFIFICSSWGLIHLYVYYERSMFFI
jgi:hypothetical protein